MMGYEDPVEEGHFETGRQSLLKNGEDASIAGFQRLEFLTLLSSVKCLGLVGKTALVELVKMPQLFW